jgi:uncharacterized membrane protein YobD (UPF0266 family)
MTRRRRPDNQDIANWVAGLIAIAFMTCAALSGSKYATVLLAGLLVLSITAVTWRWPS